MRIRYTIQVYKNIQRSQPTPLRRSIPVTHLSPVGLSCTDVIRCHKPSLVLSSQYAVQCELCAGSLSIHLSYVRLLTERVPPCVEHARLPQDQHELRLAVPRGRLVHGWLPGVSARVLPTPRAPFVAGHPDQRRTPHTVDAAGDPRRSTNRHCFFKLLQLLMLSGDSSTH